MSADVETSKYLISPDYPGVEYFDDEVREGFFVSSMMKRYWAAQIKVLSEIDKVCRKHDIRWFADCGTLLGAVRHGGMIPWDDDMDICMLRKDWLRFFEIAKDELPEEYCVLSLRTETEYENVIGRVVNAHAINYSDEHMKEFFGCPYTVGVDIFPLDDLSEDEEKEERRRKLANDVSDAYEMIDAGKGDTQECRSLLAKIESDNHITLHRKGNILRELRLLTEKLFMMYASDEAENIVLMPFWVSKHNHKYAKDLYKDTLYLPFEYIRIPVPARYEEVLQIEYRDYMSIRKGGGIHDYPVYKEQEEILRAKNGGNPFRFTLTGQAIDAVTPRKTTEQKCYEMTCVLLKVHEHVESLVKSGNVDPAAELLGKCQNLAVSLGTLMENSMPDSTDLVHRLEDYCELIFESSEAWNEESRNLLDRSIKESEEAIRVYFRDKKKDVLFIVTKAELWNLLKPLYDSYLLMDNTEVYVLPITYHIADKVIGINGEERNDRELLPEDLKTVSEDEYVIDKRHPDVIVSGYPYDGWGATMDVPETYYSENLRSRTDELIYVPCFNVDPPINDNDKAVTAIKVMVEQPAILYSDRVVVKSEKLRKCYIDSLTAISGHAEYWTEKLQVMEGLAESVTKTGSGLPDDWKNKLCERKVLLFGFDGAFLMEHGRKAIEKLKEAMNTINEASEYIICVVSPSTDLYGIENADPELWAEYNGFMDSLAGSKDVIIDYDHDAIDHLDRVSGYYGTPGELAHRCRNLRKPVMLMKIL